MDHMDHFLRDALLQHWQASKLGDDGLFNASS
jgi:hypothetical protein